MGNVTGRIDARGYFWQTLTNAQGWLTDQIDPLDHATVMTYDTVGNRTTLTDPEHNTTTYTYTANNQLETTTDPLGGVNTTHYTKDGMRKDESDANNVTTSYAYDSDGRLTTIVDGAGNATTLQYGQPNSGMDGLLVGTTYPTFREEYRYDARGNRTQLTRVLPGENGAADQRLTTATGYDAKGQKVSDTDALGRTTQFQQDSLGRLKTTTDAMAGVTAYTYDVRGNLATVTDANHHTHTFTYDKANRVTTEARPLGETIEYQYDELGNIRSRMSARGERRIYRFDNAGRRTTEDQYLPNAQIPSQTIAYSYDGRNLLTGYTQSGDAPNSSAYGYDVKGQKLDESVTYGVGTSAITKTIHYAYEPNGLKKSLTYADGTVTTSTYNRNRLTSINVRGSAIEYHDYQWRVPTKVTMPGATRVLTYDPLQRPIEIKSVSVLGTVIMDYLYIYDDSSSVTQRTTDDGSYFYTYDNLGRLTSATPPINLQQSPANPSGLPIEQYTYDRVNNRATSAHQPGPWTYNENNEILSYGANGNLRAFSYDENGNTEEEKVGDIVAPSNTRSFTYNAAERLTEIKDNGGVVAKYQYDAFGRRFKKETQAGVVWFQYSDEGLIAEYAENGAPTISYGWKMRGLWGADPVWSSRPTDSSVVEFYHNDNIGTPQIKSDLNGSATGKHLRSAYGGALVTSDDADKMGFAGQYEDSESGLVYNFSRYYSADTGRYVEQDPLGLAADINLYAYVGGNPVSRLDESGLCWSNAQGVAHFYLGGGQDVTMDEIGCTGELTKKSRRKESHGSCRLRRWQNPRPAACHVILTLGF